MSYLIDTNILSELRKGKRCDRRVALWFEAVAEDEIFLSVLTIGEIRKGIERIQRRDGKSASALNLWLQGIVEHFQERMIPIDRTVAEEWGRMNVPNPLPVIDSLLAATAKIHDLTLVTRNVQDVAGTGVSCLNPFS